MESLINNHIITVKGRRVTSKTMDLISSKKPPDCRLMATVSAAGYKVLSEKGSSKDLQIVSRLLPNIVSYITLDDQLWTDTEKLSYLVLSRTQ